MNEGDLMATVKEIAQAAGCSPSTVSIVLRGDAEKRKISEETVKKVLDTAEALGYQPNIAARSLRNGVGNDDLQIAMFWAQDFRASMMIRFWDGLRLALEGGQRNVRLLIVPYTNGHLKEARTLTRQSDCHGAIICNASQEDLDFLENNTLPIPVVLYNRTCSRYCSVNVDDVYMGALAANALLHNGCQTAAILTGESVFTGMQMRNDGFLVEGRKHGLQITEPIICENNISGGYNATHDILLNHGEGFLVDGIFCSSSAIAHGAIRAFSEAGIAAHNMPKLIAIGNGVPDQDRYCVPSLSVIHMPMEEMAKECLSMLLQLLTGQLRDPQSILLQPKYIARESCPK